MQRLQEQQARQAAAAAAGTAPPGASPAAPEGAGAGTGAGAHTAAVPLGSSRRPNQGLSEPAGAVSGRGGGDGASGRVSGSGAAGAAAAAVGQLGYGRGGAAEGHGPARGGGNGAVGNGGTAGRSQTAAQRRAAAAAAAADRSGGVAAAYHADEEDLDSVSAAPCMRSCGLWDVVRQAWWLYRAVRQFFCWLLARLRIGSWGATRSPGWRGDSRFAVHRMPKEGRDLFLPFLTSCCSHSLRPLRRLLQPSATRRGTTGQRTQSTTSRTTRTASATAHVGRLRPSGNGRCVA